MTAIRPVLPSFILRTIALWVVTRTLFTAYARAMSRLSPLAAPPQQGLDNALSVAPVTAILIGAVVAALVLNDVRVMRERAFLANIGVGLRVIGAFAFVGAISLETVLALLLVVVQ